MYIHRDDILSMNKLPRLNLINSITGIKPANLIGTQSTSGDLNLAVFSSVLHLGSNPALLGFMVRPTKEVPRHTYENIKSQGVYTINHVHEGLVERAHFTSAKFERDVSEFEKCDLKPQFIDGFEAPFVEESLIKIGLELRDEKYIELNGTIMIIGEIEHILVEDSIWKTDGHLDLTEANSTGISGLNSYYSVQKISQFPYARPKNLPDF
ncbi:MAG: flavin oxidoreductase [Saprospiraceae bacterium]|nr:flavin oxidoreductase [Saprospiraceae bacterium]